MARRVLTAEDARDIRALVARGDSQAETARRYGLSRSQVSRICSEKTWKGDSRAELKARVERLTKALTAIKDCAHARYVEVQGPEQVMVAVGALGWIWGHAKEVLEGEQ